jgi:2-oxoglutarate ferredoxin oxidoreductase subunit alpha
VGHLAGRVRAIVVLEMNLGQLLGEVEKACAGKTEIFSLLKVDGSIITPRDIVKKLEECSLWPK